MALGSNDIALKVGFDIDRFSSELSKTNGLLTSWSSGVKNSLLSAFSITAGLYAFQAGVRAAFTSLTEFSKQMSEVKAITGATGRELEALRQNALNLAGAFKAIDVAKLETEFGRLGFSTQEILDSTKATIDLATATGSDLAQSAVIAGSTLRAFQLDAKEMGRVTDVMAGALNRSGLDMSNFAEAIKYVAPNAAAANISIEETAAMLGILADNGIKGSMAGTSLRRIITDLSTEAKPLAQRLQELGDKGLDASGAMDEIGRIGATSLIILSKNSDAVKTLGIDLKNVKGEAAAMAGVMQDNLIGDWAKFNAEIDKTIQKGGFMEEFFRRVTQSATAFTAFLNGNKDAFKALDWLDRGSSATETWNTGSVTGSWDAPEMTAAQKYSQSMSSTGAGKKIKSSPLDTSAPASTIKEIAESANYASKEFMAMWHEIDLTNDAFNLMHEEVAPEVQIAFDGFVEAGQKVINSTVKIGVSVKQIAQQMKTVLVGAFTSIAQAIGQAFAGGDIEGILLASLGNIAMQVGQMAIGIGVALLGIKEALLTLNPFVAIAAGIALVALGSYASSQASSIGQSMGSSGAGSSDALRARENVGTQSGTFRIDGRDLVYAYDLNKGLDKDRKG